MNRIRTVVKFPISMAAIRRYARRIAERFDPDKIILFGSYAYGTPNEDSDVDLLVIMPARNELDQAVKIRCELRAPFPMDLLVCKPKEWNLRVADDESFCREIVAKGKVLHEKLDAGMGQESGRGLSHRKDSGRSRRVGS